MFLIEILFEIGFVLTVPCPISRIMDQIAKFVEPGKQFAKDSIRLVRRCTKPDRKGERCSNNDIISKQ